jgi:hypothetical protein
MEHVRLRRLARRVRTAAINDGLGAGRYIESVIDKPGRRRLRHARRDRGLARYIRQSRDHRMRPTIAAAVESRFRI